ncbi:MAG: hypothetical protein JNK87_22505 [Bryobacterales bacterium]|nr:hypothetical protein [Bryobacterales bacterium]
MRSLLAILAYCVIVYRVSAWAGALYGWTGRGLVLALAVALVIVLWKRTMGGMLKGLSKREEAETAKQAGNFDKAEQLLLAGIEETRRSTNKASRGILHWDLVELYTDLERFDDAIDHLRAALEVTTGDSSPYGRQIQECGPGRLLQLYRERERWDDFEAYTMTLVAKTEPRSAAALQFELALVLMGQGKTEQAVEQAEAADRALSQLPDLDAEHRLGTLLQLTAITWQARDPARSLAASERLLAAARALGDDNEQKSYWLTLSLTATAQAMLLDDDIDVALERARDAIPIAKSSGDSELHAHSLYVLAKVLQTADEPEPAREAAQEALEIWESAEHEQNSARARELLAELRAQEQRVPSAASEAG